MSGYGYTYGGGGSYELSNDHGDYRSSYQATPRTYAASGTSSATSASTVSSSQSYSSYDSNRMPRAYSTSATPPRFATLEPGEGREMALQANRRVTSRVTLPCEFVGFSHCNQEFLSDEVDLWIQHIAQDHLKYKYPEFCVCWFCDDFEFDSRHPDVGGRRRNFSNRMDHIAAHILEEGKTADDIRPDFPLLNHLHECKIISSDLYERAKRYRVIPSISNAYPPGWRPPASDRQTRVLHDNEKEERKRRRESGHHSGKHHKSSHHHPKPIWKQ